MLANLSSHKLTARSVLAYSARVVAVIFGLWVFSLGIVLTLRSGLGLGPWDVFSQGLSRQLPITLGQASITISFTIVLFSFFLGVRPGVATVLNGFFVGFFIDQINTSGLLPELLNIEPAYRVIVDVAGVLITGAGSALYIKPQLGAGPRDSLMLALHDRLHVRVGLARAILELMALTCGWLLGGTVGVGALIFAFGIGPAIELFFRLFRVQRHKPAPKPAPGAAAA